MPIVAGIQDDEGPFNRSIVATGLLAPDAAEVLGCCRRPPQDGIGFSAPHGLRNVAVWRAGTAYR